MAPFKRPSIKNEWSISYNSSVKIFILYVITLLFSARRGVKKDTRRQMPPAGGVGYAELTEVRMMTGI
ncbi:MAG: hypothetical protein IJF42_07950 [Clostridia bacterium]|nr:hypothetical protein [Clostridia bacterium]